MQVITLLTALSSVLVIGADAASMHARHGAGHNEVARRLSGEVNNFTKRDADNSRWSFYNTETGNAGSCGRFITNNEYVVAMNVADYKQSDCFKKITMTYNGKTTTATIGDQCPGCPPGGLDLSEGLFKFFESPDAGIIYGKWSFGEGGGSPPPASSSTTKKPTSSSTQPPKTETPKPTSEAPKPTTTKTTEAPKPTTEAPKPTTTKTTTTSSSSSSKPISLTVATTSSTTKTTTSSTTKATTTTTPAVTIATKSTTTSATTTSDAPTIAPVGAANAGSNKFLDNAAPAARSLSAPVLGLSALAAIAALAL